MEENKEKFSFEEVAAAISQNFPEHEKNIKLYRVTSSMISLEEFHRGFEEETKRCQSNFTPTKTPVDDIPISDYQELLRNLEEYPSNLQKQQKKAAKPLLRMHNTVGKEEPLDKTLVAPKRSPSPPCLSEPPTALQTFTGFKNFKQKLNQLSAELRDVGLTRQYMQKLDQLCNFAKQLEKLLPGELKTLSEEERDAIKVLQENLEDFMHIQKVREMQQGNEICAEPANMTFMRALSLALNELNLI